MKKQIMILGGVFTILLATFVVVSCTTSHSENLNNTEVAAQDTDQTDYFKGKPKNEWNELTADEKKVIVNKGTEYPGTGKYVEHHAKGIYTCKRCEAYLFKSGSKFDSGTGWPSFDDTIPGAVEEVLDADGQREEIVCNNCKAHLGHVFYNEGFTKKNTRHCVNSISLSFVPQSQLK